MDILIKSFNRAYYLDRCIESIKKYTKGINKIRIVDDGTPQKYLNKIQSKYKNIEIIKSSNYLEKSQLLKNKEDINGFYIPVKEWKRVVEEADKYILIIEDDVWFKDYINLDSIQANMEINHIDLVKLGWQGVTKFNYNFEEFKISDQLIAEYPSKKLFLNTSLVMKLIFENKFKLKSILCRLKMFNNYTIQEYFQLFSILMGVYDKDYWLYLWKDIDYKVSEKSQIINAVDWRYKNLKNKNSICRTKIEFLKTTYSSTATNSYRKYNSKIDINLINYVMNELWFDNKFHVMNNMPLDFDYNHLIYLIKQDPEFINLVDFGSWKNWINEFKESAKKYGAQVD